jgi:hypothetical protein
MTGVQPAGPGLVASGLDPAVVEGVDVDALATAVLACPAVDDLCAGAWGGVVSYLPGRQVPGVRVTVGQVVVSVRGNWGVPAAELARQIRAAAAPLAGSRRIDVVVADVTDQPATAPAAPGKGASWTTSSAAGPPGAPSSGLTTPTGAAIPPPLPPA